MTARVTVHPTDYALELTFCSGTLPERKRIVPQGPNAVDFWIPMTMTVTMRAAPDVGKKESKA